MALQSRQLYAKERRRSIPPADLAAALLLAQLSNDGLQIVNLLLEMIDAVGKMIEAARRDMRRRKIAGAAPAVHLGNAPRIALRATHDVR